MKRNRKSPCVPAKPPALTAAKKRAIRREARKIIERHLRRAPLLKIMQIAHELESRWGENRTPFSSVHWIELELESITAETDGRREEPTR